VQIQNYSGVFTDGGTLNGVIVQIGTPTPANGVTFNVNLRVMLLLFGDGKIGSYQFNISYAILQNVGSNCS
jgi:hypothetical protein